MVGIKYLHNFHMYPANVDQGDYQELDYQQRSGAPQSKSPIYKTMHFPLPEDVRGTTEEVGLHYYSMERYVL